jgi:hypothetical protein
MKHFSRWIAVLALAVAGSVAIAEPHTQPSVFTINSDNVIEIDGKKVFPIGFTLGPAPGAKAPDGREGLAVLADAGGLLLRTGTMNGENGRWDDATIASEKEWEAAAARNGMYCMPWLHELALVKDSDRVKTAKLKRIVDMFRNNPGLGYWKGPDEPEWGKLSVEQAKNAYEIIKQEDPNHPVWTIQAPRGSITTLRPYVDTYDIGGMDVYPVSEPAGSHSNLPNKQISMVGDYTKMMMEVQEGRKPVTMTLQIAWSGVAKPGKKLMFPTFQQERFMAYEAIIDGSRGLTFFGGQLPTTLRGRDSELGWNWTFWDHVLAPVMKEIGNNSPLQPALVAPNSKLSIHCTGAGMEYVVRQTDDALYILACKRQGPAIQAEFTGLPSDISRGQVMYEAKKTVATNHGTFTDMFGPFDVHVYVFPR